MTQEYKTQPTDDRPAYEAPRALRLGGTGVSTGQTACQSGSSNVNWCVAGTSADGSGCEQNGDGALTTCLGVGIGALTACLDLGNGFD